MNNLKQYAGLLNEVAPKGEFLAYINEDESKILKEAGASGLLTPQGIPSYRGAGGYQGGSTSSGSSSSSSSSGSSSSGNGGGGRDTGSDYGQFDRAVSQAANNPSPVTSGGGDNNTVDPGLQNALRTQQINAINNFDYETEANIDAGYGLGEITNATYNAKTGLVDIEQTSGIINTEQYQTANLGAYLDSPDVSDKSKAKTLNQLQALSNSNLKGSKLSNIETDFVLDNLDLAFNNIKDQTKYSKYTSSIDETNTTFADDFSKNPLGTAIKSGGVIGSMFKGITDNYKNNKALEVLGYTGKTIKYNPDGSGGFNYGGGFLTGNAGEGERDAVNQLTPQAANIIGGTQQQASQAAQWYNSIGSNTQQFNFATAYANAKTKVSQTLNNKGQVGLLAVNDSPFYDWLKTKNLDRGIL